MKSDKITAIILTIAIFLLLFAFTPHGRKLVNGILFDVQKADDETRYKTQKDVEDSCRSMIASYTSDVLIYEQYKDSENEEKQSWAEQAKIRANKTASTYNEYVLKNSFVWDGNIPKDIKSELPYI